MADRIGVEIIMEHTLVNLILCSRRKLNLAKQWPLYSILGNEYRRNPGALKWFLIDVLLGAKTYNNGGKVATSGAELCQAQ